MEISSIMDIHALAGNRKLKPETSVSERRNGENIRRNPSASVQEIADVQDLVSIESGNRISMAEVRKEGTLENSTNGNVVNIHT